MNPALSLLAAGLMSMILALVTNWLALIPWRRSAGKHWTERARVYHPVRTAAAANLLVIPAVMALLSLHFDETNFPSWVFIGLFSAIGTVIGTLPMDREVFPRIGMRDLIRQATTGSLMRLMVIFVFLGAAVMMPKEFNYQVPLIFMVVFGLWMLWANDLWLRVSVKIGYLEQPPERLQNIVDQCSAKMNVSVRETWIIRLPIAQAFALPQSRRLLFSDRLLEVLSDDELSAICSHELAHLTEKRSDYLKRYISLFTYLPWLMFKPLLHTFGILGFVVMLVATMLIPVLSRRFSHKMEVRADDMATAYETDQGAYARALALLHEDALVPAVVAKDHATHPHLYDRLLAAGVTPDYPRPKAAGAMAWHGMLFSITMGILVALLAIRSFER